MLFKDWVGTYRIVKHRDGTATLKHILRCGSSVTVKNYKSVESAKRGLARYCGGMPKEIKKRYKRR